MGLVAPRHVGSSQTRAQTRVACISRQILNHCATREALSIFYMAGTKTGAGEMWKLQSFIPLGDLDLRDNPPTSTCPLSPVPFFSSPPSWLVGQNVPQQSQDGLLVSLTLLSVPLTY